MHTQATLCTATIIYAFMQLNVTRLLKGAHKNIFTRCTNLPNRYTYFELWTFFSPSIHKNSSKNRCYFYNLHNYYIVVFKFKVPSYYYHSIIYLTYHARYITYECKFYYIVINLIFYFIIIEYNIYFIVISKYSLFIIYNNDVIFRVYNCIMYTII